MIGNYVIDRALFWAKSTQLMFFPDGECPVCLERALPRQLAERMAPRIPPLSARIMEADDDPPNAVLPLFLRGPYLLCSRRRSTRCGQRMQLWQTINNCT